MDPLKRLHKLQEEEFERYAYYKEKYTKDLLDADMPADRKERLMEGIEAAAKIGGNSTNTSGPMAINPPSRVEANGGEIVPKADLLKDWAEYTVDYD